MRYGLSLCCVSTFRGSFSHFPHKASPLWFDEERYCVCMAWEGEISLSVAERSLNFSPYPSDARLIEDFCGSCWRQWRMHWSEFLIGRACSHLWEQETPWCKAAVWYLWKRAACSHPCLEDLEALWLPSLDRSLECCYFFTQPFVQEKHIQWENFLAVFNFQIQSILGKENVVADALSCKP